MLFVLGCMSGIVLGTVIVYYASKSSFDGAVKRAAIAELAKPENHIYLPVNNPCCVVCGGWENKHVHTVDSVAIQTRTPLYPEAPPTCKTC